MIAFSKDLVTNPATRNVHDVRHEIVAAASSTSKDRAAEFLTKVKAGSNAKPYGSYHELVADPDVQIVYVATPHSHHFQNAMLALEAGKHVLCEKSLTINASQARKLVATAKEKKLFFMEAVWTRYFPLSIKVRELITSGTIGNVYRVIGKETEFLTHPSPPPLSLFPMLPAPQAADVIAHPADLSINADKGDGELLTFPDSSRMVNLDLAGGALLDLGIYSLTWVFQTLYHIQPEAEKEAPKVFAAINKYHTGADESTSMILQFPKHKTMGIGLTSMRLGTDPDGKNSGGPAIKIQGSKGEIQVMGPAYCPLQYKVIKKDGGGAVDVIDCPIPQDPAHGWGHGMFWEADECARCLRDGKLESSTMPWSESVVIMEVMEETLKQGGVTYPHLITTDVYDPESPLNRGR